MTSGLRYTFVGDGSSDRLLEFPIRWALATLGVPVEIGQWADFRSTVDRPKTLKDRIRVALELYPADLLLVHRDAEATDPVERRREISTALPNISTRHVAIVPVRMTEAWFLHSEDAIRRASGNPNGKVKLSLPSIREIETKVDPKDLLRRALLEASELSGRRREKKKAEFPQMRKRTAELIVDFSPLMALPAFALFVSSLRSALVDLGHLSSTQEV